MKQHLSGKRLNRQINVSNLAVKLIQLHRERQQIGDDVFATGGNVNRHVASAEASSCPVPTHALRLGPLAALPVEDAVQTRTLN